MQVTLGRRGDYAVRALIHLAGQPGRHGRRSIAGSMDIPLNYLHQVLAPFVQAGIVRSTPGRGGGYELARPAATITLREVIELAEGPIGRDSCLLRGGPCHWEDRCALHETWAAAEAALGEQLSSTTFAELAATDRQMATGHAHPADHDLRGAVQGGPRTSDAHRVPTPRRGRPPAVPGRED